MSLAWRRRPSASWASPRAAACRWNIPRRLTAWARCGARSSACVLGPEDYNAIIRDIVARRYSRMEIAAFLVACAGFMTEQEVLNLTRAMANVGQRLHWGSGTDGTALRMVF